MDTIITLALGIAQASLIFGTFVIGFARLTRKTKLLNDTNIKIAAVNQISGAILVGAALIATVI